MSAGDLARHVSVALTEPTAVAKQPIVYSLDPNAPVGNCPCCGAAEPARLVACDTCWDDQRDVRESVRIRKGDDVLHARAAMYRRGVSLREDREKPVWGVWCNTLATWVSTDEGRTPTAVTWYKASEVASTMRFMHRMHRYEVRRIAASPPAVPLNWESVMKPRDGQVRTVSAMGLRQPVVDVGAVFAALVRTDSELGRELARRTNESMRKDDLYASAEQRVLRVMFESTQPAMRARAEQVTRLILGETAPSSAAALKVHADIQAEKMHAAEARVRGHKR